MTPYIYQPREPAMGRHTYRGPDPVAQIRDEGLRRRYIQRYGVETADRIYLNQDAVARADLAAWRALGRSVERVSA
jgi:hypothetical protein